MNNSLHKPDDRPPLPETLPFIVVDDLVVFPFMIAPLILVDEKAVAAVDEALGQDRILGLTAPHHREATDDSPSEFHEVGAAVLVVKMMKVPDGKVHLLVQGLSRVRIVEWLQTHPTLRAKIMPLEISVEKTVEIQALTTNLVNLFKKVVNLSPNLPEEAYITAINIEDPGKLADFIASSLNLEMDQRQELLELVDPAQRMQRLTAFINSELEVLELGSKIQSEAKTEMDKAQREYYLRQQLKAIQKELGEEDERTVELNEIREKIEKAKMPDEIKAVAEKELDRLSKMPPQAAEYTVSRTYLDWLITLPWSLGTEDRLDIAAAHQVLEEDHYDLEKVKERILEYLSVRKLKKDMKGPILCFVGPPGVGKTSLGRSIARALGRKFVRMSLGGIRDEAEIRGFRRTYVGSMPGRIIQGLRNAESNNPVFMLDEIDKVGMDFRGDPSAALLEVLDPEQNFSFHDHYLDVPFDLSKVMFITTANILDPIPSPLRDRMEVLRLPGYTPTKKISITKRFLIPRQLEAHGLTAGHLELEDSTIASMIRDYTKEAGLRNLEREVGTICRKVARKIAESLEQGKEEDDQEEGRLTKTADSAPLTRITPDDLHESLGPVKFFSEVAERKDMVGVATGMAWTEAGGDILFIETAKMKGKKGLTLTGQLGEVMKESAQTAVSYIRSRSKELGISESFFDNHDLHIHVPAGAIPKDGPSAGIALATALVSLLTGHPTHHDLSMTGEITLTGKVLPIGGVKEKVLAAYQAGIKTVVLPEKNQKDLEGIPQEIRDQMRFEFVSNLDQVLELALVTPSK